MSAFRSWIRRWRFRTRLLVPVVGLLALVQLVTLALVARANRTNARTEIDAALDRGARQFERIMQQREADLLLAARVMAGDYAMRQLFLAETLSPATVRSALASYRRRINAPVIVMLDEPGKVLAAVGVTEAEANLAPVLELRRRAEADESAEAAGFGFLDGGLHQLVVVPLFAPRPVVVAWIGIGFHVDAALAEELQRTADLEVSFLAPDPPRLLASTLRPDAGEALRGAAALGPEARELRLDGEDFINAWWPLRGAGGERVWIVLQRSLARELAAARALERRVLAISLAGLAAAVMAALFLARSVSRPVHRLAEHTRVVAEGDYRTRLTLDREDELGELATAFNAMSAGLEERDRVRDLLDKNVSPEVARQLLQDGAALGGEERDVTILFADLRGFTSLSERLSPRELVALLNRYLDRMSAAIEAEGGIIDKFIGDEIMALFGAPVEQPDAADRAVRAALRMRAALAALNAELAAEAGPTLAFGIGINTAQVVAGNIGSHRRLNYSVVGDGVNVAARLQTLTRQPDLAADIIVSAAALRACAGRFRTRDLGRIQVKGRAQHVQVFALESPA